MRPDQAHGEFGAPLYLAGFECQGPRAIPRDGSTTVWEVFEKSAARFPTRAAVGTRRLIKVHEVQEGGRWFEKLELENSYTWANYSAYMARVRVFANGLVSLTQLPVNGRMVIYAETQRDWMIAALGAFAMSVQVVTIYTTLGEEGALFGLQQTRASVVLADAKLLKILVKIAPKCSFLKHVITVTPCDAGAREKLSGADITVSSFDEVLSAGQLAPAPVRPPSAGDVAVIMYTSGTTAAPKGVMISHGNIVAGIAGFQEAGARSGIGEETVFMAYLPLAHIMEMIAEISTLAMGASMGYGTPHTLIESGVKLKRPESEGDAALLRPTLMVFAPAVLDKVYKGVSKKVEAGSAAKRFLFSIAVGLGSHIYDSGGVGAGPLGFAFGAVQRILGGRVQYALTGSAPLSPEIQQYIQTVLNCPVRQGYGLTENCACATLGVLDDNTVKDVGPPQASAIIRLVDWEEGAYRNSDASRPDVRMPRGEVLVGGPTVSIGYLVDEENPDPEIVSRNETDYVTIEGVRYFRTGDIGQITERGTLQIIDRKKDLWKGPQGEYVALSKVEAAIKMSSFVEIPMAYGRTGEDYIVALICISEAHLERLAVERGLEGASPFALCKNPSVVAVVQQAVTETCKASKLVDFEIPRKIALLPGADGQPAWTPENDMLTAAMKLKRPIIAKTYAADIDALYGK